MLEHVMEVVWVQFIHMRISMEFLMKHAITIKQKTKHVFLLISVVLVQRLGNVMWSKIIHGLQFQSMVRKF